MIPMFDDHDFVVIDAPPFAPVISGFFITIPRSLVIGFGAHR